MFHSFLSPPLFPSHRGYQMTRRVFFSIILSSKDPLSSIDASREQSINHFFLWNGARLITHFALLDEVYGCGASTHMIKIPSHWYAAIIGGGIYLNGLCHHIAFTYCVKEGMLSSINRFLSFFLFFHAGKLLWFAAAVYSRYFLLPEKASPLLKKIKFSFKAKNSGFKLSLNSELFICFFKKSHLA